MRSRGAPIQIAHHSSSAADGGGVWAIFAATLSGHPVAAIAARP